jgi:hypothetical protein
MPDPITPCEYARSRHRNAVLWMNLWNGLLFVFGSAIVIVLLFVVVFFLRQSWVSGAVSTLATIVDGVAVRWVLARRTDAKQEENDAYNDVIQRCNAPHETAMQIAALHLRDQARFANLF